MERGDVGAAVSSAIGNLSGRDEAVDFCLHGFRTHRILLLTLYSEGLLAGGLGPVSGLAGGTPEPVVGGVGLETVTVITG